MPKWLRRSTSLYDMYASIEPIIYVFASVSLLSNDWEHQQPNKPVRDLSILSSCRCDSRGSDDSALGPPLVKKEEVDESVSRPVRGGLIFASNRLGPNFSGPG
jgi:hypothetical protein